MLGNDALSTTYIRCYYLDDVPFFHNASRFALPQALLLPLYKNNSNAGHFSFKSHYKYYILVHVQGSHNFKYGIFSSNAFTSIPNIMKTKNGIHITYEYTVKRCPLF